MGTFQTLQAELASLVIEHGASEVEWRWYVPGWSSATPNADRRWECVSAGHAGVGSTGEEAMRGLIAALRASDDDGAQ